MAIKDKAMDEEIKAQRFYNGQRREKGKMTDEEFVKALHREVQEVTGRLVHEYAIRNSKYEIGDGVVYKDFLGVIQPSIVRAVYGILKDPQKDKVPTIRYIVKQEAGDIDAISEAEILR